uniref:Uncharacterized protein n=1 Tax=Hyaloperonospora arabidopsidis (strain Emoy2) TaxID=559515 RepID=M4C401_HYAAE
MMQWSPKCYFKDWVPALGNVCSWLTHLSLLVPVGPATICTLEWSSSTQAEQPEARLAADMIAASLHSSSRKASSAHIFSCRCSYLVR